MGALAMLGLMCGCEKAFGEREKSIDEVIKEYVDNGDINKK